MPLEGLPSPVEFLLKGLLCAGELISWDSHGGENEVIVTLKFSAPGENDEAAAGDSSSKSQISTKSTAVDKGKSESQKDNRPIEPKVQSGKSQQKGGNESQRNNAESAKYSGAGNDMGQGQAPSPKQAKARLPKDQQPQYNMGSSNHLGNQQQHNQQQQSHQQLQQQQQRQQQQRQQQQQQQQQRQQQQQQIQQRQQQQQQQQQRQQQQQQQQQQQNQMRMPMPLMPMALPIHMMQQGQRMAQMASFNKPASQFQGNVYGFTCYNKNRPGQQNQAKSAQEKREREQRERQRQGARPNSAPNLGKGSKQPQVVKQNQQKQVQQLQQNKTGKKQPTQNQTTQQGQLQNKHNPKSQSTGQQQQGNEQSKDQQNKQQNKQLKQNKKQKQRQERQSLKHSCGDGLASNSADETNNGACGDWSEQMEAKLSLETQEEDLSSDTDNVDQEYENVSPDYEREDDSLQRRNDNFPEQKKRSPRTSSVRFAEPECVRDDYDRGRKGIQFADSSARSMDATIYNRPNLVEKTYEGAISVPCLVNQLSPNQCPNMIAPDDNYFECEECRKAYCGDCAVHGLANPRSAVPAALFPCFNGHAHKVAIM